MNQRHIKRLPVVDREGKLIGIVSRADLLRVFLRPDAEIATEASAVLTDILLADPAEAHATARDGVVTLSGRLASQDRTEAAVRLTEAINGVVAVTSKLTAPPSENWPDAGYHIPNRDLAWDAATRSRRRDPPAAAPSPTAASPRAGGADLWPCPRRARRRNMAFEVTVSRRRGNWRAADGGGRNDHARKRDHCRL
jgi:CBS domain-containing protein